jgi:hypothetical protein
MAWERGVANNDVLAAGTAGVAPPFMLCQSASEPVPLGLTSISGRKYQASNVNGVDFHKDDGNFQVGFACLRFEISNPQSYQYNYISDSSDTGPSPGNNITATAIGNLNGDTVYSTFKLTGSIQSKALTLAPSIEETNPDE